MSLTAGTRLGPYEIVSPLGAGGMGEVYRARDTRLGREVAIKVLPADRLADQVRRARFVQEARAASALNHPNIVTIHEIESAEGVEFIVMELVPGKTLDALIPRQGMRLGEALRVAIPLADALAAAHAAGIVHRDLKPANVMVTPEGVVKVLDFGLAKLTQTDGGDSEDAATLDARESPPSRPGSVAGTPAYMSPEQASGGLVDARSDVFAFGAVLYEMVTGRRAFAGGSSAEMLAAVLKEQPKPPSELLPDVPRDLERIIQRCLRKERERRFQNMLDVKVELQEVKEESDSQAGTLPSAMDGETRRRRRWFVVALALTAAVAATAMVGYLHLESLPVPQVVLVASSRITGDQASFSPDGNQVAFSSPGERGANWDIWLKIIGEAETHRLTNGPAAHSCPAWSPDGLSIAFTRRERDAPAGTVYLVSPLGGPERRLSDFPVWWCGLSWSPDGHWLAVSNARAEGDMTPGSGGIHLIPAGGGEPHPVTFPKPPYADYYPAFSPNGRALAFFSCLQFRARCDLHVLSLDAEFRPAGAPRRLPPQKVDGYGLAWTRDGRSILYGVTWEDRLWRVRADGASPPEPVELAGRGAYGPFTVASRDRLGFIRDGADFDIYKFQMGSTAATSLIASTVFELDPQYSPDGQRIAFLASGPGESPAVWLADADGSNLTRLTRGPGRAQTSPGWSPDGRTIVFEARAEDGHWDVWTIGVEGAGLRQISHRDGDHGPANWSRDGRWIYFTSNRTGRDEIWRVAVPSGAEQQITRDGGSLPFESLDGGTLFYKRSGADGPLLARPTSGGAERTIVRCVPGPAYAVGPEGVFHVDCVPPRTFPPRRDLRYWDARTGQDRLVATLDVGLALRTHLSVSPDGQSVLFTRFTGGDDLMMIENFR